jgi:hypothetical protein
VGGGLGEEGEEARVVALERGLVAGEAVGGEERAV